MPDIASQILESLTPPQREAARHVEGPLLMLAGPGSGKTRVVTHRIAYLIERGIHPRQILALTFTNKAAEEMQARLERLAPGQPVWIGTFHRFCARLLRTHARLVGLQENYSIYDTQDSLRALKQTVVDLKLDLTHTTPETIASAISRAKNDAITADKYQAKPGNSIGGLVERIYPAYQKQLLAANAVDFDDLLLHVSALLADNPELRRSLDERFQYVMVDEYQDTNLVQYAIVRSLSVDFPNLAVTGDPDQSIYGWRGANLNNILEFEHDYPNVRVVRLEQNFRSTPNILRAADQLIAYNVKRKEKHLIPVRDEGTPVRLMTYPTGRDEADHIALRIQEAVRGGQRRLNDFAIFYRTNALSRALESALRSHNIPFQIINGLEFYQRKEIKDVMAYLQLLNNPANDVALRRIINTPPRQIGAKTLQRLGDHAWQNGYTLLDAARQAGVIDTLQKRAAVAVAKFVSMYDRIGTFVTRSVEEIIREVLDESGYHDWLEASETEEDQNRLANIEELITAAREFDQTHPDDGGLEAFLEQVSLTSDTDAFEEEVEQVTLMTLHAAKGLEFPVVFIVAVEQGLLPHERSNEDFTQLEEERRLLFVGITRAEEELQLSVSQYRDFRGSRTHTVPSSFLMELPREEMELIEPVSFSYGTDDDFSGGDAWNDNDFVQDDPSGFEVSDSTKIITAAEMMNGEMPQRSFPPHLFQSGMVVEHPDYGAGKIVSLTGRGAKRTATIEFFGDAGERSFRLAHSPLFPVETFD